MVLIGDCDGDASSRQLGDGAGATMHELEVIVKGMVSELASRLKKWRLGHGDSGFRRDSG